MKVFLFAISLMMPVLACAAGNKFQERCEENAAGSMPVLQTKQTGYTIDNSHSIAELTEMRRAGQANGYSFGLTKTSSVVAIDVKAPTLSDSASHTECLSPQIAIQMYYSPMVIYIGSEFKPGSCAYNEVLAHELRHRKTYLDFLPKAEGVVRAALNENYEGHPLYIAGGGPSESMLKEIAAHWMPYVKAEMRKAESLHAEIDTAEESVRLSKVCQGEVQSILGAYNLTSR